MRAKDLLNCVVGKFTVEHQLCCDRLNCGPVRGLTHHELCPFPKIPEVRLDFSDADMRLHLRNRIEGADM